MLRSNVESFKNSDKNELDENNNTICEKKYFKNNNYKEKIKDIKTEIEIDNFRSEKHKVSYGDFLYINWTNYNSEKKEIESGYLAGDVFSNPKILFHKKNNKFDFSLDHQGIFKIINKSQIDKENSLINHDSEKESILIGQDVLLLHVASGKYMMLKEQENTFLDKKFILHLVLEPNFSCLFKFFNFDYKHRVNSVLKFQNIMVLLSNNKLFKINIELSNNLYYDNMLKEGSQTLTEWKFYHFLKKEINDTHVKKNKLIQIINPLTGKYLVSSKKNIKKANNVKIYYPTDKRSGQLPFLEHYELNNLEENYRYLLLESNLKENLYSYWIITQKNNFDQSCLKLKDSFYLINFITEEYLQLELIEGIPRLVLADEKINCLNKSFEFENYNDNENSQIVKTHQKYRLKYFDQESQEHLFIEKENFGISNYSIKNNEDNEMIFMIIPKNDSLLFTIKESVKRLLFYREYFLLFGSKSMTTCPNLGEHNNENTNFYKIFYSETTEGLIKFKEFKEEYLNTLNFIQEKLTLDKIKSSIYDYVCDSDIFQILIEIIKTCVVRYFHVLKFFTHELSMSVQDPLKLFDEYLNLKSLMNTNEFLEKISIIDGIHLYEIIVYHTFNILFDLSIHYNCLLILIIDEINFVFPLLAIYPIIGQILVRCLEKIEHVNIIYLIYLIIEKFMDPLTENFWCELMIYPEILPAAFERLTIESFNQDNIYFIKICKKILESNFFLKKVLTIKQFDITSNEYIANTISKEFLNTGIFYVLKIELTNGFFKR